MSYAKIVNNQVAAYPFAPSGLRHLFPNVSFPALLTDQLLAEYGIVPVTPAPQPSCEWHERVEELSPAILNGEWVQQWQVVPLGNAERDQLAAEIREARFAALAQKRWEVETGGITFNGMALATDAVSQTKYIGAVVGAQLDPAVTMKWKLADGSFTTLDAGGITAVAMAVRAHVQACFDREAELKGQIEETTNPDAVNSIDINAGWPV